MDSIPTVTVQPASNWRNGVTSPLGNIPNSGRDLVIQQNPSAVQNPPIINQLNQSQALKRPGIQKPVVERAPRSLFLFRVDNKFRKG